MATIRTVSATALDLEEVLNLYSSVGWSAYTDSPCGPGGGTELIVHDRRGTARNGPCGSAPRHFR